MKKNKLIIISLTIVFLFTVFSFVLFSCDKKINKPGFNVPTINEKDIKQKKEFEEKARKKEEERLKREKEELERLKKQKELEEQEEIKRRKELEEKLKKEQEEIEKKQKEFEQNLFEPRNLDEINGLDIEDTLIINKNGERYFIKKEKYASLLTNAFVRAQVGENKQLLYFTLDITEKEFKNFKENDKEKFNRLIANMDQKKYRIPLNAFAAFGRENIGLLESEEKDSEHGFKISYLNIDKDKLNIDNNILPKNNKVYFYTLANSSIKYAFVFKDTNIYTLKEEDMVVNDYSNFEKPESLKYYYRYNEGNEIVLYKVDDDILEKDELNIKDFVKEIDTLVFKYANFERINLNNVKKIQSYAFEKNRNLKKVEASNLEFLNTAVFMDCDNLEKFTAPNLKTMYSHNFMNCKKLKDIKLSKEMTLIDNSCFYNCESLVNFDFENIKTIGDSAFKNCTSLKQANFKNIKKIYADAFENCENLEFDSNVLDKDFKMSSFYNCKNYNDKLFKHLFNIEDETLKTIKNSNNKSKIDRIIIPEYINTIYHSFVGCTALTSIDLKNVRSLKSYADFGVFYGCTALTSIDLKNVKKIGRYTFDGCASLTSIDLKNVKYIGDSAFENCTSLKELKINGDINGNNGFYKVENGKKLIKISTNETIINLS